ncbi:MULTISPECIES: HutD family protein [unclassified Beijerinckia]|uniref:HutD/Ves family protein n=1 Tax=unclassified Beijerinckia TaxID=2638183 RepID=UPI000894813C|nr:MULTISPECIES: HutD family protein [unclassified Beijerinckia]MDH7799086.1 environmental stress-induced protein Ves [Beijerinckia sp. GAS462]SED95504.1 hypothetical protein SAMN05443249_6032 [Beijerinckia sp. 28-YEA-48]
MRLIHSIDYRRMPWKNGGGVTIEVAIAPDDATLDDFDWRISMAHVATPGPFSRFPGVDRTLAVLSGAGIRLAIGGAPPVTLDLSSPPHAFSGHVETNATLIDGAIDDLNVMSNQARYRHRMTRHQIEETVMIPNGAVAVAIMPRAGGLKLAVGEASAHVADGDTVILDQADLSGNDAISFHRSGLAPAEIYLMIFWPR